MDDEQIEMLIKGISEALAEEFKELRFEIRNLGEPGDNSEGRAILYHMDGKHETGVPSDTDALMWIRDELVKVNEHLDNLVKAIRTRP